MSGDATTLDPTTVAQAGITRIVSKPINPHELLGRCAVDRWESRSRMLALLRMPCPYVY